MTPADRRDRAETTLYVNPRWVPTRILTVALRWVVIIVEVMLFQRPQVVLKRSIGVFAGASCCRRCFTKRHKASFGNNSRSPVAAWPILSPRTPFFYVLNVRITNVAAATSSYVAVALSNTVRPTLKVTSDRQNGVMSDFFPVYSPGRRRKKKAIIIMSTTACNSWSLEAAATQASRRRTWTGIGFTRVGGGS